MGQAADTAAGLDTAMLAWRRANVAELNRRGRQAWEDAGRLSGPELVAPGGLGFARGDRIVTLAASADGQLVTSERGTVQAVDPATGTLTAYMHDGRLQQLGREDTAAERPALHRGPQGPGPVGPDVNATVPGVEGHGGGDVA